ncbi:sugar phosphate isomerase/epimerase family protein [Streptomyces boncukensis]|uniref:Sugar phosphate isomerase/epimerase n=1 Tax=Streptomyces boncukensis TaxID=2711219 RepID=A0A6G4WUH3_9ACTN|nr:sugar phosphate isomerase/epimerase family protein [Streptomyces boncukensis]NGO68865.1 sugar phosphate isomerase/epimerase [Streptomyces boncukensis]
MGLLDRQGVFLPYLHLLGAPLGETPRYSFDERVAAASSDEVTGIGFDADEFDELLKNRSADELRGVLDSHGVAIGELQILFAWHFGDSYPEYQQMARDREQHMYELCGTFGIDRIKTVIMTPTDLPPHAEVVERFAAVCDRAAEHGVSVAMETQSVHPGFDYADTADLILDADRPNGGFVVDAWHFFRDPDPWTALDRLPADKIFGLELRDAAAEPHESRLDDCLHHNKLPGEGDFDLVRLIRELDAKGVDVRISAEILSAELRPLSAQENVDRTAAAVRKVMEAARA